MSAFKLSPRLSKFAVVAALVFVILLSAGVAGAQKNAAPFVAPVPEQILNAKTVFISNAGLDPEIRERLNSANGAVAPFSQFYSAVQSYGRYTIVPSPATADLVLEYSLTNPVGSCLTNSQTCSTLRMTLAIYDVKTHFVLWTFMEQVDSAMLSSNFAKNVSATVQTLVADLKAITTP